MVCLCNLKVQKITVDGIETGLTGLENAIMYVKGLNLFDEEKIKEELLIKIKELGNYITPSKEKSYKNALFEEYINHLNNEEKKTKISNIPREEIAWYPTINEELCTSTGKCVDFCQKGVYVWDEQKNKPIVKNPYNCTVFCSGCEQICPSGAISFPNIDEFIIEYDKLKEKYSQC